MGEHFKQDKNLNLKEKSKKHAKELESKAKNLENLRDSGKNIKFGKIRGFYELAGDIQTRYNIYDAIHDYHQALNYTEKDKERMRIQNKITDARISISGDKVSYKNTPFVFLSIAGFIISLFFLSINFTGAVVGSVKNDFSILGILFFLCGLVGAFVYARNKR